MKKLLVMVTLAALLMGSHAMAQPGWVDNIGIFSDVGGSYNCENMVDTGVHSAYLMIIHSSSFRVGGWEVKITSSGGGAISAVNPRGDFINAANRQYEYIVGLGSPLMVSYGNVVILADIEYVIFDVHDPFKIFLGPVYYDTLGNGLPAYLDGSDPTLVKRLLPAIWTFDYPQFLANYSCGFIVDSEQSSFGTIKALYR